MTGTIVKFDSNGSYVGSTSATHGVDLVVWAAVSLDLDGNRGIWAAERSHSQFLGSVDRLVHFDVDGNMISGDTLTPAGSPFSVRVDRDSGLVWVAMIDGGRLAPGQRHRDGAIDDRYFSAR